VTSLQRLEAVYTTELLRDFGEVIIIRDRFEAYLQLELRMHLARLQVFEEIGAAKFLRHVSALFDVCDRAEADYYARLGVDWYAI
jgi:hypothetical protein